MEAIAAVNFADEVDIVVVNNVTETVLWKIHEPKSRHAILFRTAILANTGFIADKDPRANGANYSCALLSILLLRSVTLLCIYMSISTIFDR